MMFAMLGLITPLTQLSIALLHGTGRVGWTLGLSVAGFVLLLSLLPVGLSYGIVGVAGAFLLRGWVLLVARLWVLRRKAGINLRLLPRAIAPPLVGGAAMAAVMIAADTVWSASFSEAAMLPLEIGLGLSTYGIVLVLFARDRVAHAIALGRKAAGIGHTKSET